MTQPPPEEPSAAPESASQPPGPGYPPIQPYPGQWQPGQPYPPGYPPYYAPYNTYAILSLVLTVAVFPPLGIYFGNKAKQQIAQTGERGTELATVGIVLGWIFTGIFGVAILIWCSAMGLMVSGSTV